MRRPGRWLALACLITAALKAEQVDLGGEGMAGAWLRLPSDARTAGLGQGGAGAALGLGSLRSNPAGSAAETQASLDLSYDRWLLDVSTQHLGVVLPWGPGVAGLTLDYLDEGDVDVVSPAAAPGQNAQVTGSLHPWAMDAAFSWAQTWGRLRWAGQVEAITEQWGDASTTAPALGIGIQGPLAAEWEGGASLAHVGFTQGYALPSELRAGLAWTPAPGWRVFGDARAPLADDGAWSLGAGVEVELNSVLSARAAAVGAGDAGSGGVSAGFSVHWQYLCVDYAYNGGGPLGGSQQLGLRLAFEPAAAPPAPIEAAPPVEEDEPRYQRLLPRRVAPAAPASPQPGEPAPRALAGSAMGLSPAAQALAPTPMASPTALPFGRLAEKKLAEALRGGDVPAAYEALERLRVREPGLARRLARAQAEPLVALARKAPGTDGGYKLLRSALHAAGEDPRLLAGMAHLCADQGRGNEAQVYVDRALAVEPGLQAELKPLLQAR